MEDELGVVLRVISQEQEATLGPFGNAPRPLLNLVWALIKSVRAPIELTLTFKHSHTDGR